MLLPKPVHTYNSVDHDGSVTYGGYSNQIVVDEHYTIRVPNNLSLDSVAPLLCAGITIYSPKQYFGLNKPGPHLGVVGLGCLGGIAVKFGKAFGMKVTVISTSHNKEKEAIKRLGTDAFLVSHNEEQMKVLRTDKHCIFFLDCILTVSSLNIIFDYRQQSVA